MQNGVDVNQRFRTSVLLILGICGLVALLVYGRGFLTPIVMAGLLTCLISAGIAKLEQLGIPTWTAMVVSIGGIFAVFYALAQVFSVQLDAISETLPRYSVRFDHILADLTKFLGEKQVDQFRNTLSNTDFSGHVASLAESVGGLFGSLGLVLMYSAFMLAERGTLTKKHSFLFPDPQKAALVLETLQSVGSGIRRYIWIKTVVSLLTGGLCYLVLKYLNVDFAEIIAVLIFLLNFIPTVGSIVGVVLPAVVTLVQFDTMTPFLTVLALCGGVQFTIGNIIEPRFMGNTLNLSPVVVVVSLTFWGTVWGIEGAFLSVPIAASIIILCRDIEGLKPIAVLMSSDGDLAKGRAKPDVSHTKKIGKNSKTESRISELQEELKRLQDEHK